MKKKKKVNQFLVMGVILFFSALCLIRIEKKESQSSLRDTQKEESIIRSDYASDQVYEAEDIDLSHLEKQTEDQKFVTYVWTTYQGQEGIFVNQLDDPMESMVKCAKIPLAHPGYVMIGCYPGREDFLCYKDFSGDSEVSHNE